MKTAAETSPATTQHRSEPQKPFFQKGGQRSFGNHRTPTIQAKTTIGQPNDPYEREADQASDRVVQRLAVPNVVQQGNEKIQRKETQTSAAATPTNPARFIVDDTAAPQPGQMQKSVFLNRLNNDVCETVNQALSGTSYTTDNCPYLRAIFARHQNSTPAYLEQTMERYEPSIRLAQSAEDIIRQLKNRVFSTAVRWLLTRDLSGLPPEAADLLNPAEGNTEPASGSPATDSLFLKAKEGGASATQSPVAVMQSLGTGKAMDSQSRSKMEGAFGTSFSDVEVHTDSQAAGLASSMNARAFTVGNHIAFGKGEHQPGTLIGDALMAHELAHVEQQKGAQSIAMTKNNDGGEAPMETEADNIAVGVVSQLWAKTNEKINNLSKNGSRHLKSGLKLQSCSRKRENPRLLRIRELSSVTNPADLINQLESESIEELNSLRSLAESNSILRTGIDWEIAFRSRDWANLLRLIRQDATASFFSGYTNRLRELIENNQTVIRIQNNAPESFRSGLLDQLSLLVQNRSGFRLIIELQDANQSIDIENTTGENKTDVRGSDPDDGRFITTDDNSTVLPINQQRRGKRAGSLLSINLELLNNQSVLSGSRGQLNIIDSNPTVLLGHELIHALHNARGTDIRPPFGANILRALGGSNYLVQDPATGMPISPEELYTITGQTNFDAPAEGVRGSANWPLSFNLPHDEIITENMLRQEMQLPARVSHFGSIKAISITPRNGEALNQMIDRYSLPSGLVVPENIKILIRQIFIQFNPYFENNLLLPAGVNIPLSFPHPQYISMHLRFVMNNSSAADTAQNLILRQ